MLHTDFKYMLLITKGKIKSILPLSILKSPGGRRQIVYPCHIHTVHVYQKELGKADYNVRYSTTPQALKLPIQKGVLQKQTIHFNLKYNVLAYSHSL
jgi:hypothetical protein